MLAVGMGGGCLHFFFSHLPCLFFPLKDGWIEAEILSQKIH